MRREWAIGFGMRGRDRIGLAAGLRLLLALFALSGVLAGPAAASMVIIGGSVAPAGMPCHETAGDVAGAASTYSASSPSAYMPSVQLPDPARRHLCCVIGQIVAPPHAAPSFSHPEARRVPPVLRPGQRLAGHEPLTPVPPPRAV
ncbi:hypothetical protein [Ancylobacter amanitiformis]|uniref:DUF2946 domain-containing protein n=1 Tax=Ancylobacter amanitiformis TaxID=217069 RepID=A0ABU0LVP8_9HYPH|nr:hypothetical protein [Ancylobacter amanitiformis]MDQ0512812.1 hypothetical protein [Ancylobacter amanitiformis]